MKSNYKAILFHPDGDYVTDFRDSSTKQEVWDSIVDMGGRWIFYPICFVGTDKTIVDTPEGLEHLKGKRIETVRYYLKTVWHRDSDGVCDVINNGLPLNLIY